jgi:hypothetical protein
MKLLINRIRSLQGLMGSWGLLLVASITAPLSFATAQEEIEQDLRPIRPAFASNWLIDNQTVVVPIKGTFEMDIIHRFGTIDNGYDDYFGLDAPSNIRLGFSYVLIDDLQLGLGITKERMIWDFNAKYAFLKQKRKGGFPLNLTYYVNAGYDSRDGDNFEETTDRFSFFHQMIIARKLTDGFSLQVAPSVSWFNYQDAVVDDEGIIQGRLHNGHIAISFSGRVKVSPQTSIVANFDQPISSHEINEPEGNLSFGVEFTSSAHAFQIFLSNYKGILPQLNNHFNQNSIGDGEFLIGFNITRLWNF